MYNLQFSPAAWSQLPPPPALVFKGEAEAVNEAERLLRQAEIAFTFVSRGEERSFLDKEGRVLIRVVCHAY
jgi:hypothetical protein